MKHAMIMTIHTNFTILDRFVELFDDERYDFYILVDKKAETPDQKILSYQPRHSRVFFVPRVSIFWGGYSQINANLRLLEAAVQEPYEYYHYFQGSDFPLKTKDEVDRFFEANVGREFITSCVWEKANSRCTRYHLLVDNPLYKKFGIVRKLNGFISKVLYALGLRQNRDVPLLFGSALYSVTRDFARYLVEHEAEIRRRFRYTVCADELFLQTMLASSEFRDRLYRTDHSPRANVRLVEWSGGDGNSPRTFVEDDFEQLIHAGEDICFARKFNEQYDFAIVEKLFRYLQEKQHEEEV